MCDAVKLTALIAFAPALMCPTLESYDEIMRRKITSRIEKDGKEGFGGGCHRGGRDKLPPLLPPTKYLELEKVRTHEKWGLEPELRGRQEEVQN